MATLTMKKKIKRRWGPSLDNGLVERGNRGWADIWRLEVEG